MDTEAFDLQSWLEIVGITFGETPKLVIFGVSLFLSLVIGRFTPGIVRLFIRRFSPEQVTHLYENLIAPLSGAFQFAGTMLLISLSMVWLNEDFRSLSAFLNPFVDLALISSMAWLTSRVFGRIFRV